MSEKERADYNREYRAEGFGKLADRKYYQRNRKKRIAESKAYYTLHREEIAARALARYHAKK